MKTQPIQNKRGRFLTSVETIDDQLEESHSRGRPSAAKAIRKVNAAKSKSPGGKMPSLRSLLPHVGTDLPARPASKGPAHKHAGRRCMAKVNYVKNRKPTQWRAAGKYLEREGAQQEGEKGLGFSATEDGLPIAATLDQWQKEGDPHMFKVVLSPEDPMEPEALKAFTRQFNQKIQAQIGKEYEWLAVPHFNTSHPHVHLQIRGKGQLHLSPDLIRRGMREAAQEVLTEQLGYRTEKDIQQAKDREIDKRRFTSIDKEIQKKTEQHESGFFLISEYGIGEDRTESRRRMARLEKLVEIGVADKIGAHQWRLEPGWEKALKEMEILATRTKMVSQARALMTEPRCPPQVTRLKAGERLVGRVLGTGLDEQRDRSYILIEGVDNRAHIVYQTAKIEEKRAEQQLQPRRLVAVTGYEKGIGIKEYDLSIPDTGFKSQKIPEEALDDQLKHEERNGKPDTLKTTTGFAANWWRQLEERRKEREKKKKLEQEQKKGKGRKSDEIE